MLADQANLVPEANSAEPSSAAEFTRITSSLLNANEQLASFLASSKEDKWKDKEFQSLVSSYLESSSKTLDLCASLEGCFRRAKRSLLTIWYAVKLFDREMETESEEGSNGKWKRLLEDLKGLKEAGADPFEDWYLKLISLVYEEDHTHIRILQELKGSTFDQNLLHMFVLVHSEQELLLTKLKSHTRQLLRKLIKIRRKRRVSNVIFGIGFFSVPVLTALVMVLPVPSAVEVLIGAFSATIGSIGKWNSYSWSKREKETEEQVTKIDQIARNTYVMLNELEILRANVQKSELRIEQMMTLAKFVMEMEDAVRIGMSEMKLQFKSSLLTVEEAVSSTSRCTSSITTNKNALFQKLQDHHQSQVSKARKWLDIFM